jgi:hypothetical protein
MNGVPVQEVVGKITTIQATGLGRNSGEITIAIQPSGAALVEVFVGVMPDSNPNDPTGTLPGPYASYVTIAVAAMTSGQQVRCRYQQADKNRVSGLQLL